jgi:hypothetical protein
MIRNAMTMGLMVILALGCGSTSSTQPQEEAAAPVATTNPTPAKISLAGTSWTWQNFLISFTDEKNALVRGPAVVSSYPTGLDATYTLKDSVVEVHALDEIRKGTFDGQKLIIENEGATRVEPCTVAGNSITAKVLFVDPYGNIVTNVSETDLQKSGVVPGAALNIKVGDKPFSAPLVNNYADVAEGAYLAKTQSMGLVELAINWGTGPKTRIADTLQAAPNTPVVITKAG